MKPAFVSDVLLYFQMAERALYVWPLHLLSSEIHSMVISAGTFGLFGTIHVCKRQQ